MENNIPKIIHYCWLSGDPYPEDIAFCIETWKKFLPDYEIMLWDTSNFDVNVCRYTKEAFQERKYAFVSDYIRLHALYNFGGIYLDSDVEVLKSFNDLLNNRAFTCFEDKDIVAAWIFGSEKGNPLFKELMDDYKERKFILESGMYDTTPNPVPVTNTLVKHGLKLNNKKQILDLITVYPMTYFCPFNPYRKSGDCFSDETYANHHFSGSWKKIKTGYETEYEQKIQQYQKIFGEKNGGRIYKHLHVIKNIGLRKWVMDYLWEK